MELRKQYQKIRDSLKFINEEIASRVLEVLETEGSAILKREHLLSGGLPPVKLEYLLTLSAEMRKAIIHFQENINYIAKEQHPKNGALYYISKYGGSKTQFIELIKSILQEQKIKGLTPYDKIIPIILNGSSELRASILGEQIYDNTARILAKDGEIEQDNPQAFTELMKLILEYKNVRDAPARMSEILDLLSDLERSSTSTVGKSLRFKNLRGKLRELPLLDDESLLKIVLDIMEYGSSHGIVYLLFYDECDEWLSKIESEPTWSNSLLKYSYFFKQLLNRIANIRIYQIFCFTPRIYEVLRTEKSGSIPGLQRLSSELDKTAVSSVYAEIWESGVYKEEESSEVTLKWLFLLERKMRKQADPEIFSTFIPTLIEKINSKLPRRMGNIKIISSIRAYLKLSDDIKYGQSQYNRALRPSGRGIYISIGNWIEDSFSSYLNYLNYMFIKKHVPVGPHTKVDGKLSKMGDDKIYLAEIKTLKDPSKFEIGKAEQVIDTITTGKKVIFFLFCRDLEELYVREKFHEWQNHGKILKEVNLDNLILFLINEQILLNCLVGFERTRPSELGPKFPDFDIIVRLINKNFHGRLLNLFPETRRIQTKGTQEKAPLKKEAIIETTSYNSLLLKLEAIENTEIKTAVEIIQTLGTRNKVYMRRKADVLKSQLTPLLKSSFSDAITYLMRLKIIKKSNVNYNFNWDIFDKDKSKDESEQFMEDVFSYLIDHINKGVN